MIRTRILKSSLNQIANDTKFIRLATITSFVHSLLFLIYIVYWLSNVLTEMQWWDNRFMTLIESYINLDFSGATIALLVIVWIILLIGYSILPPIWEAAMLFYLDNPKKQWTISLGKWVNKFFPMFEFDAATSFFQLIVFLFGVSRMYIMGILDNPLSIGLLLIRFCIVVLTAFLLPYSRLVITLENKNFFEAMRESMNISTRHFFLTFRFVMVDLVLHARFVLNIIIIVGIPLLLMRLADWIGITASNFIQAIFIIIIIWLFLITAYINGIIEAFFSTYWYKVYQYIKTQDIGTSQLEQEITSKEV